MRKSVEEMKTVNEGVVILSRHTAGGRGRFQTALQRLPYRENHSARFEKTA